jgi:hypothetical protein
MHFPQKKCETYWPESTEEPFVPTHGSPLTIKYVSVLPFAEFVIRKMEVTHVSHQQQISWLLHQVPLACMICSAFIVINCFE